MPPQTARRLVGPLLAATLLAGCGSTVQHTTSADLSPGLGVDSPAPVGASTAPLSDSNDLSTMPSSGGGRGAAGSGTTPATGPGGEGPAAVEGPGVPRLGGTLAVGIPYLDQQQTSAFTAGFGTGLESGDDKVNYQILIDDLNKQGGILGRKVVPVFHRIDFTASAAQYEQEACTDFTQDRRVAFVLSGASPTLTRCLVDRGVGVLGDGSQVNTKDYDAMPFYVQPGSFALDRLAALQAKEFTDMGLFKGATPARVGVLFYDLPTYRLAEKVLVDGLKRRGVQVVAEEAFHYAASTQDLGQTQGQVQSAVLKFRSLGVTHVVGVELNAWLQGFFALYGSQQEYFPRYGWTSNQVPTNVQAVVPHEALVDSLFIGFYPTYDTEDQRQCPVETLRCFRQLTSQGVQLTSGNMRSSAVVACDSVRYLKAALTAGNGLSRVALVAGARALQRSFIPSVTYASFLPKGYGGGAAAVRRGAWVTQCDCFAYTSKPYGVS